jgi:O-antigen ligase
MKLEFWKAGAKIAFENPLLGVGIGDVPDEFSAYYKRTNTWLSNDWRLTCHNQYLYIAVAGGFLTLMLFLIIFISVLKISWNRTVLPFKLFIGIVSVAMLTEDMLTTQAGVSLVAFFLSIFVLGNFRVETSSKTTNQIN